MVLVCAKWADVKLASSSRGREKNAIMIKTYFLKAGLGHGTLSSENPYITTFQTSSLLVKKFLFCY